MRKEKANNIEAMKLKKKRKRNEKEKKLKKKKKIGNLDNLLNKINKKNPERSNEGKKSGYNEAHQRLLAKGSVEFIWADLWQIIELPTQTHDYA